MPFTIVRQDITKMKVDAIVNAANTRLRMGGGVCGAIFNAAGADDLSAACEKAAPIEVGGAAVTPGFKLPSKYVIHAAGPVYNPLKRKQCALKLRSAYTESLKLADEYKCESVAFPLISSGIYGYPKEDALKAATEAITGFLETHEMNVYLAVFDKASFVVSKKLAGDVESYIDEHYIEAHPESSCLREIENLELSDMELSDMDMLHASALRPTLLRSPSIDDMVVNLDEPFSDTLMKLIDKKGKTDVEVYKKANIDRKLFSKIRTGKGYTPRKATILALAVALELTLEETDDLLERAGYAISHASKFDVIVEYFIINGHYNIFDINEVLFKYDQPLLGG